MAIFRINTCLCGETALAALETTTYCNGGTALAVFGVNPLSCEAGQRWRHLRLTHMLVAGRRWRHFR